jgi:predicted Zn-dependent peptidase
MGVPSFRRGSDERFAVGVLNAVLGGGMSSRLFQEVREKRGLAYSVYSFSQAFADTGYLGVYTGTIPAKLPQALQVITDTLLDVANDGLSAEEIQRGKGQLRGSLILGQEDTGSRTGLRRTSFC